jgi:hypothetical protein
VPNSSFDETDGEVFCKTIDASRNQQWANGILSLSHLIDRKAQYGQVKHVRIRVKKIRDGY